MSQPIPAPEPEDRTADRLLDGRLILLQPAKGYRAGMDAALLAAACDARPGSRVLEAGCGPGGALLAAALRCPEALFTGVERNPEAAALARVNIERNGLAGRVEIVEADIAQPFARLGLAPFDAALANPPFFDDPGALRAPHPSKREAWMAEGGLAAWTGFLAKAVREGGSITLIHQAERLGDILALLSPKCGSFQVRPVHPHADAPAKRVLVRAIKTGKAPLRLLPALVLHPRQGAKHTPEAEAILRGEASLAWL
ncbi:MAG TPA: methyltransferase [Phenylobacterium sp.]|nr:methyltransferase [Phenylobacterium sp.]